MRQVLPFILCGGAGTRLWPLSREAYPKQFHRLTGPETLFQLTCRRLAGPLFGELCILSNYRHRFLIAEQLEEIGAPIDNLVLEPVTDIGMTVGFSETSSFSAAFRKATGVTPTSYHRSLA